MIGRWERRRRRGHGRGRRALLRARSTAVTVCCPLARELSCSLRQGQGEVALSLCLLKHDSSGGGLRARCEVGLWWALRVAARTKRGGACLLRACRDRMQRCVGPHSENKVDTASTLAASHSSKFTLTKARLLNIANKPTQPSSTYREIHLAQPQLQFFDSQFAPLFPSNPRPLPSPPPFLTRSTCLRRTPPSAARRSSGARTR